MDIRPIKTDRDYEIALEEIDRLLDAGVEPGTPEGDRFEVLSILVENFEEENYPIPLPDPIEAIKYFLDSRELSNKDLEPFIGGRARVWEILNRRRSLSLNMIRRLSDELGIPAEILIQPYELAYASSEPFLPTFLHSEVVDFSVYQWQPKDFRKAESIFKDFLKMGTNYYKINANFQLLKEDLIDLNLADTVHEKVEL